MGELLEKSRMINRILQKTGAEPVSFNDICETLSKILDSNVYVISRKGKILGYKFSDGFECQSMKEKIIKDKRIDEKHNNILLEFKETQANLKNEDKCIFDLKDKCNFINNNITIVPIIGSRERLGTLLLSKLNKLYNDDDLVLAEYSATIVGMEILKSKQEEIEEDARKKAVVQLAIGTLSYSELEAVEHIFDELHGNEGLLVASKIADKVGITRSVIVNALRKFESAGVIESRSLGMKGTHIKILNDKLLDELKKIK